MAPIMLMFSTTELLLLLILAMVLFIGTKAYMNIPTNLPPGPKGIPLLGYLPFIRGKAHAQFKELAEKYGEIFSLSVGHKLVIVLNDYEIIKEALISENFSGRSIQLEKKTETVNFSHSEGEVHMNHRRFAVRTFRDLGLGKNNLENRIKEEIDYLLNDINQLPDKPVDIGELLYLSVSNIILSLIHGKRLEYNDNHFEKLVNYAQAHTARIHPILFPFYVSLVSKIPGAQYLFRSAYINVNEMDELIFTEFKDKVKQRDATHQPGSRNDIISAWLTEDEERKATNRTGNFSMDHLARLCQTLFIAGTHTVASSLGWALIYLMSQPEVQKRVQKEIDKVIGQERTPSQDDQEQMPYTTAVLMELQRITSLAPFSVFHSNFKETNLRGYTIPSRSIIIPHLRAVHHNPSIFPHPDKFQPERFLNAEGKVIKEEKLIPFGIGKRQCLGKALAKMELFLYFTSLLQQFTFKLPDGVMPNFNFESGLVSSPLPFKVIVTKRKHQ